MEYIEVFNRLDQEISEKLEDLQRQQEQLLERKKYLLETKQKIHCFLSDAYEMKQLLDFNPQLAQSVKGELNKIFQPESQLNLLTDNASINVSSKSTIQFTPDYMNDQELDSQLTIDSEQEEPIKIYKFVDSEGKDTSF